MHEFGHALLNSQVKNFGDNQCTEAGVTKFLDILKATANNHWKATKTE